MLLWPRIFQSTCPRGARPSKSVRILLKRISIHVPTRGTTVEGLCAAVAEDISIHVPTRGTTIVRGLRIVVSVFQSTCPRGARLARTFYPSRECRFQSTCPRGARPIISANAPRQIHFNPRAHEGHDDDVGAGGGGGVISIHVPTRGTTLHTAPRRLRPVFQSTCPRGARLSGVTGSGKTKDFNPRAHEGHDARHCECIPSIGISIHVPTRGTTMIIIHEYNSKEFQSTCPRGARHHWDEPRALTNNFNPRAHEGHDKCVMQGPLAPAISIHVPTRGTTNKIEPVTPTPVISIHVPTRGTTRAL